MRHLLVAVFLAICLACGGGGDLAEGPLATAQAAVVPPPPPEPAPAPAMVSEASVVTAWRLDVDGAPGAEILAEASTDDGSVLVLVAEGWEPAIVYDTRREPPGDDADEPARTEYELNRTTLTWLGVTDAELDGRLEIVVEGSGWEASWIAVLRLGGDTVGSLGCAV